MTASFRIETPGTETQLFYAVLFQYDLVASPEKKARNFIRFGKKKRSLETMAGFGRTFPATEPEKRSWGKRRRIFNFLRFGRSLGMEGEREGSMGGGVVVGGAEAGELTAHRTDRADGIEGK